MRRLACLAVHAERLHVPAVWAQVARLAARWARRGRPITFFVHPFWAVAAGADTTGRLRELAGLGHEVAQHTHYDDHATGRLPGHKRGDLSDGIVRRRLEEDHAVLTGAGLRPVGFVSGAWNFPEVLVSWLAERSFSYDCSLRTYAGSTCGSRPVPPQPFRLAAGLLEVPTTASLSTAARNLVRARLGGVRAGGLRYQLVCLHHDDLLDPRKRAAVSALAAAWGVAGWQVTRAADLATILAATAGASGT